MLRPWKQLEWRKTNVALVLGGGTIVAPPTGVRAVIRRVLLLTSAAGGCTLNSAGTTLMTLSTGAQQLNLDLDFVLEGGVGESLTVSSGLNINSLWIWYTLHKTGVA